MKTYTDKALERVRAYILQNKLPIRRFAEHACMPPSTIRNVMADNFNTSLNHLRKMEEATTRPYQPPSL